MIGFAEDLRYISLFIWSSLAVITVQIPARDFSTSLQLVYGCHQWH